MIPHKVASTLRKHDAFAAGELVIVAVSGGGDSVALLHVLRQLQASLGIRLHVASLNHGLRAEAGQRDLAFVADLARRWQMPFSAGHADVPRLSREWGMGIEAAARRARYAFLACVARKQGSDCVAVGHHLLDQAETIVMSIVRGSGMRGLRGMQIVSEMPHHKGIRLVRPLLRLPKSDLETYCRQNKLAYQQDESNADIGYRRNFVRHEIIGRLRQLNPELLRAFDRLAESAGVDEDYISAQFEAAVMPLLYISPERWGIKRRDFAGLHPALQRRFVIEAFRQVSPGAAVLSHGLTLDLIAWAGAAATGDRRDMSAAIQMRLVYDDIYVECKDAARSYDSYRLIPAASDWPIVAGSPFDRDGMMIRLSADGMPGGEGVRVALPAGLDLRLRTRRPGDRFKPKGMGGHSRKIKQWMIDRKIPRELRDRIPLVSADDEIIAICLGARWHIADLSHHDARAADRVILTLA